MPFQNCKIVGKDSDAQEYHAVNADTVRGSKNFVVSSGMLKEFGHCGARWVAGYEPPESDAKDFGSLFDCIALTPAQFDKKYALRPETYKSDKGEEKTWNNNATVCKEWNEAAASEGRKPLKRSELIEAQTAVRSLGKDQILAAFILASERQVWVAGEWLDETTGLTIPVKALVDLAPKSDSEFHACLGDIKTTRSAKPAVWSRYSSQRGYHIQAALYLDLWNAAVGEVRDTFCHVLVENFPPYQTGRSMLSQQKLEFGRIIYRAYLGKYAQCLKTGAWPDYQSGPGVIDGWSLDDASRWDEMEAMAALEQKAEPDPDEPPPTEADLDNSEQMN